MIGRNLGMVTPFSHPPSFVVPQYRGIPEIRRTPYSIQLPPAMVNLAIVNFWL